MKYQITLDLASRLLISQALSNRTATVGLKMDEAHRVAEIERRLELKAARDAVDGLISTAMDDYLRAKEQVDSVRRAAIAAARGAEQ